jgi:hypothetical protein
MVTTSDSSPYVTGLEMVSVRSRTDFTPDRPDGEPSMLLLLKPGENEIRQTEVRRTIRCNSFTELLQEEGVLGECIGTV